MDVQLALGDGLPQPLYLLLQGSHSSWGPPMGFPHLGEVSLGGGVPSPPEGFVPRRLDICQTRLL